MRCLLWVQQACVRDNCDSICSNQQALQHVKGLSRDALVALISDTQLHITAEADVLEVRPDCILNDESIFSVMVNEVMIPESCVICEQPVLLGTQRSQLFCHTDQESVC